MTTHRVTSRGRRRATTLLAALAAASLLAACGGAPDSAEDGDPTATEQVSDGGGDDPTTASDGGGTEQETATATAADATDEDGDEGAGDDDGTEVGARWPARLPSSWSGTISSEPLEPSDGIAYLVLTPLYETYDLTEITTEEIEGSEFVSAQQGSCEGSAILDGQAATCTLVADPTAGSTGDPTAPAEVRLVHGPYGNPSILTSVDAEGLTDLPIAPETPLGLGRVEPYLLEEVTAEDVEGALREGVLEVGVDPVDLPADTAVECEVVDEGLHALCEITGGIEDGGVEGFWYATAQPGPSSDAYDGRWYLFSRFPDQ